MTPAILLIIQVAAGPIDPMPARVAAPDALHAIQRCDGSGGDEVVVCGRSAESPYRLKRLPDRYDADAPALPKAEVGLAGGKLSAEGQQGNVGNIPTNRAMLSWRIRF